MSALRKRAELEVPQIDGVWRGAASIEVVEQLRNQWYSMEKIAKAFGVTRKTLYNRINATRAADSRTSNGPTSPPSAATDEKAAASQHENQQFTEVGGAA